MSLASSSSSSNPWNCSTADIALNPVNGLIKRYYELKGLTESVSLNENKHKKSDLISKLRQIDSLTNQKKDAYYQVYISERYPEIAQTARRAEELDAIINKLTEYFEKFAATNVLRDSYFHTIRASQVIWDELSQENKGKLVQTIRSAVKAIEVLNNNRVLDEHTAIQCRVFEEVVLRSNIGDESRSFDDFYLDDLHELLTECSNSLELFRQNPVLKEIVVREGEGEVILE